MRHVVSGPDVGAPSRWRASRRHASGGPDILGRSAGVGLLAGAVVGLYLGFASGGGALGRPVVITLAGMLGGLLIALAVGSLLAGRTTSEDHWDEDLVEPRGPSAERAPEPRATTPAVRSPEAVARAAAAAPIAPAPRAHEEGDHLVPPGWYPDPRGARQQRYWDGVAWTTHLWSPRER